MHLTFEHFQRNRTIEVVLKKGITFNVILVF